MTVLPCKRGCLLVICGFWKDHKTIANVYLCSVFPRWLQAASSNQENCSKGPAMVKSKKWSPVHSALCWRAWQADLGAASSLQLSPGFFTPDPVRSLYRAPVSLHGTLKENRVWTVADCKRFPSRRVNARVKKSHD